MIDNNLLFIYKYKMNGISIMSSTSCNLNCSYCIQKYKHSENNQKLDKEIVNAWETGSYFKTIRKVLEKLYINPTDLNRFSICGGETLLHIDAIIHGIPAFFNLFTETRFLLIGTNFLTNIHKIPELLKTIDESAKRPLVIYFVVSMDGPQGILTQNGHIGSPQKYYDNIKFIEQFIDSYNFTNIKGIYFRIHPTINKDTFIEYFSDEKNIMEYMKYNLNNIKYIRDAFKSDFIRVPFEFPDIAAPLYITSDDASKISEIYKKWDLIKIKYFNDFLTEDVDNLMGLYTGIYNGIDLKIEETPTCSSSLVRPTIFPDGTIVECSTNIYGMFAYTKEELEAFNDIEKRHVFLNQDSKINVLTATPKEINDYLWKKSIGSYFTKDKVMLNMISGLMDELALSGQIPYKFYGDMDSKIEGMIFAKSVAGCPRMFSSNTGIHKLPLAGNIRFALNGFYDHIKSSLSNYNSQPIYQYWDKIHEIYPTRTMRENCKNE